MCILSKAKNRCCLLPFPKPSEPLGMSRTQFPFVLLPSHPNPTGNFSLSVHHILPLKTMRFHKDKQARPAQTVLQLFNSFHSMFTHSKHPGTLVSHSSFFPNINNALLTSQTHHGPTGGVLQHIYCCSSCVRPETS